MQNRARLIAFYLPQFHPTPENDLWWGKGFTEWTNVTRARPLFPGHNQPRQPADLGYYDLRVAETREEQVRLARHHGIHGFCYHFYWFENGKRMLERPLEEMLASGKPDFPFCLCWANENWTKRWDGLEREVLLRQDHSPENDLAFLHGVLPYLRDPRYICVDGRPLLVIYRTKLFPDLAATVRRWRDELARLGEPDLYLVAAEAYDVFGDAVINAGFDALCEFPPHQVGHECVAERGSVDFHAPFSGALFDYEKVVDKFLTRPPVHYRRLRGVTLEWDNTARRRGLANIMVNYSLGGYHRWLSGVIDQTARLDRAEERLVFINAWNEWAEGTYLEPDARHGLAPLQATLAALEGRPWQTAATQSVAVPTEAVHAGAAQPLEAAPVASPCARPAGRLRLVSLTLMGCEADIAEDFVRANLRFLDHMVIALNNAHDGTTEILEAMCREGLPITLSRTPSGRFEHREAINRLARELLAREQPDWLIPLDADEFIDAPDRAAFEQALIANGARHARVAWRNHVATAFDDESEASPVKRLSHCYDYPPPDAASNPWVWKTFIHVPLFAPYTDRYQIGRGAHRLELIGLDAACEQPSRPLATVRLRHFPARSHDQMLLKGGLGWIQLRLTEGGAPSHTVQWKVFSELIGSAPDHGVRALQQAARQYLDFGRVKDEALAETPITYSPLNFLAEQRYAQLRLPPAKALLAWLDSALFAGATAATPSPVAAAGNARRGSRHTPYLWQSLVNVETTALETLYHDKPRRELLPHIGDPGLRMMDIGCGAGATSWALKKAFPHCHVTGFELNRQAAQVAAERLDQVIQDNVETLPLPDPRLPESSFDTILLADVLEHLANPWQVLIRLRPLLSPRGRIVACIPNIFNLRLLDDLARGNWHYTPNGLLDITHVRFFTAETMQRMFEETGYRVISLHGLPQHPSEVPEHRRDTPRSISTDNLSLINQPPERIEAMMNLQYVLVCAPLPAAGTAATPPAGAQASLAVG